MFTNSDEGLKAYARQNILSYEEVCDILKVSRQYLYRLVTEGKIKTIKQIKSGYLFWKPDVLNFDQKRKINAGYGLSTHRAIKDIDDLNLTVSNIDSIHIYRYCNDAAIDDFYQVIGGTEKDQLMRIEAPSFVIKMADSTEYWISSLLCGYRGESTNGTKEVLTKLGVINFMTEEELESCIENSKIIHIYKTDNGIEIIKKDSYWNKLMEESEKIWGWFPQLYSYNGKLILIIERRDGNRARNVVDLPMSFVETCFDFLKDVVTMEKLSKDNALDTGHYLTTGPWTNIYQIILSNEEKRELWMLYPNDVDCDASNNTMCDILFNLGYNLSKENAEDPFLEKLKRLIPRSITRK